MIHEILPAGSLQCNCSVIGDEITRGAMVIDPGDEIEEIVATKKLSRCCIAIPRAAFGLSVLLPSDFPLQ